MKLMVDLESQIIAAVSRRSYQPLKPKALARKLGVSGSAYAHFRRAVRELLKQGRLQLGKNHTLRQAPPHGTATGVFRKTGGGFGFVRAHAVDGQVGQEIYIPQEHVLDASTGDEVLVRVVSKTGRGGLGPRGEIVQVIERSTRQFVGTYFERDGQGYVRVDGTVFSHSIYVGDPGAKGARPDDKVVLEMLRFPSPEDRGEAVITEILGPRGKPGVDTLSIIREFGLPDKFAEEVLEEARAAGAAFDESELDGREDLTRELTITIDPADARDFDDAVSLVQDPKTKHWLLGVHIADVGHFAPPGSELDLEAKKRGNSVYLPQRVLPMFPEIISNSLASLQQGRVRYVKSVFIEFTPVGQKTHVRFANAAINVRRRFNYDEVSAIFAAHDGRELRPTGDVAVEPLPKKAQRKKKPADTDGRPFNLDPHVLDLLLRMRELALVLRQRRFKRGSLQLHMPEVELEYDEHGRMAGAHFATHDISHQIIEEFMLAANEAVAEQLNDLGVPFLRRIHPAPDPEKLKAFAEFARILGYKIRHETDRFALQRVLDQSADKPEAHAVHYALLRSLKQAIYSPEEEGHYALASDNYCHFTSPIRRYPDLVVHRLLHQWLRTGKAGADETELAAVGEHCSKTERRADIAERELIKTKLLTFLADRIGLELEVVITGVADYGFYGQAEKLPIEGLVHISTLTDDYYYFDEPSHSLTGKRYQRRFRLGDKVHVKVVRVDLQRRQLDFRVVAKKKMERKTS
jgi:ribonuclease R